MTVRLHDLPSAAASAWLELREELEWILGDDLIAMWGWGSTVHPDRPRIPSDLDTQLVVARALDEHAWDQIQHALATSARNHDVQWDVGCTLAADVGGRSLPRSPYVGDAPDRRDVMWAVNRAHWLAGGYVSLLGPPPEELVSSPTWHELEYALGRELEHLERHVIDGPHDAYEGRCAVFNGSRVLNAYETHDTTLTKRAGGIWALANLPERWHDAIDIANRSYDAEATDTETAVLVAAMAPFVAMVRERVPELHDREPGAPPRWSV